MLGKLRKYYSAVIERINLFLYDTKNRVVPFSRLLTFLTALAGMAVVIYYYGFPHAADEQEMLVKFIRGSMGMFLGTYFIRLVYASDKLDFFKRNAGESLFMWMLIIELASEAFFGYSIVESTLQSLFMESYRSWYLLSVNLYMLVLVGFELLRYSQRVMTLAIRPAILFAVSFVLIILVGAGLLKMPEMSVTGVETTWLDAVFTSASATCVTGLITLDTATHWTFKGHFVILLLMQVGGIGILSFASFFTFFLRSGVGVRHQTMLQDLLSADSPMNTRTMLTQIVLYTILIEGVGALLIYSLWSPDIVFTGTSQKIFYSVFHAVSGFCNAGFALFSNGLMEAGIATSYLLHLVFVVLIVIGGIGFPVLREMTDRKILRERMKKPWKNWSVGTTVAIYSTIILVVGGTLLFWLLEEDNTLAAHTTLTGRAITALFQSVTARTAGFNTVDLGMLAMPTYILFIFLMFIGASSGGTGGGIKTSTFFVILQSGLATIRGKQRVDFQGRTISQDLINKAYTLFIFGASFVLILVFGLSISEPDVPIIKLVFEAVSAFATVGVTAGVTGGLSVAGKVMIIVAMFFGRIGILTLAFAISSPVESNKYQYPKAKLVIG